ncbi:MAG: glucose-1-phosphate cytidylyltransferase [Thiotrichales bacterium]|nr:MAG: glucose-1-phosphate cytidylyltransferase [Thiotrichales bacterium]
MKAVILAGGLGTRLSEETHLKPKPMVEIGGMPILWHIMKIYSAHGINEFIICLGYKGYVIKEYFANYYRHMSDVTFDFAHNTTTIHNNYAEPWKVTLVDTGRDTMTGGRLRKVKSYLAPNEDFCFTYGDGLSDVNISKVIALHKQEKKIATVTAVQPPGRFGSIEFDGNTVNSFKEKPKGDGSWINGGFFVLSPKVLDYVKGDASIWEQEPMHNLAQDKKMNVYFHKGFWQPMDTLREKTLLETLWQEQRAPWKVW